MKLYINLFYISGIRIVTILLLIIALTQLIICGCSLTQAPEQDPAVSETADASIDNDSSKQQNSPSDNELNEDINPSAQQTPADKTEAADTIIYNNKKYLLTAIDYPDNLCSSVSKFAYFFDIIDSLKLYSTDKEVLLFNNDNLYCLKQDNNNSAVLVYQVPEYIAGSETIKSTEQSENRFLTDFCYEYSGDYIPAVFLEEGTELPVPDFDYSLLAKCDELFDYKTGDARTGISRNNDELRIYAKPFLKKHSADADKANEIIEQYKGNHVYTRVNIIDENILSVYCCEEGGYFGRMNCVSYLYDLQNDKLIDKTEYLQLKGVDLTIIREDKTKKWKSVYENDPTVISVATSFDDDNFGVFLKDSDTIEIQYAYIVKSGADENGIDYYEPNPSYFNDIIEVDFKTGYKPSFES